MAIFSAIALLVALGLAALLSLQPWATDSVAPDLSVAPGLGVGLSGSVAVASGGAGPQLAVAPAQPAAGATPRLVAAGAAVEEGDSRPRLGIAAARAVAVSVPQSARPPASSPGPSQTELPPEAQPVPPPAAVPVAAPVPSTQPVVASSPPVTGGGGSPGPVGAGAGPVGAGPEAFEVHDGDEQALAFSFYVQPTAYRAPGDENLIMQFRGEGSESPSFALQLWDDDSGAQRGLWASGAAMGGERFLAPVEVGVWHEAVVCFQASNDGDGFYLLLLDGQPIDARAWVSLIDSGGSEAQLEVGLFREGEPVLGTQDVLFGPTRLGDSLESVLP